MIRITTACRMFFTRLGWRAMPVLLVLSGCTVLPESETLSFYRLSESPANVTAPAVGASTLPLVLRVETPYANRAIGSTRILVEPEADRISVYKGARWSDAAPVLLRDRLVEQLRHARVFRSVVTDSGNLSADLELTSELYGFHVVYESDAPVAVVILDATLIDANSARVLASQRFRVERAVQGKEVPEVVQAFGYAVDELAGQLITWSRINAERQDQAR